MECIAQGRYVYKLLAVDVPAAAGGEQRIFLEGDEAIYNRGSVIGELRDPFLNVRLCQLAHGCSLAAVSASRVRCAATDLPDAACAVSQRQMSRK